MTTIVAVKDKKGAITYGWDSQGTLGYDIETFTEDQPKVFTNGGVTEYNPYAGIGSGSVHAVGVLARGGSVLEALEFAAGKDIFTSGPFTVKTVTELLND